MNLRNIQTLTHVAMFWKTCITHFHSSILQIKNGTIFSNDLEELWVWEAMPESYKKMVKMSSPWSTASHTREWCCHSVSSWYCTLPTALESSSKSTELHRSTVLYFEETSSKLNINYVWVDRECHANTKNRGKVRQNQWKEVDVLDYRSINMQVNRQALMRRSHEVLVSSQGGVFVSDVSLPSLPVYYALSYL